MESTCHSCGASVTGIVCHFCGGLSNTLSDADAEMQALDQYHGLLVKADGEQQSKLLQHGFLPQNPPVLIEAGLRVIPLIREDALYTQPTASAIARLKAVMLKLRLLNELPEAARAAQQFEARLKSMERVDADNARQGFTVILILLVLIGTAAIVIAVAIF